MTSPSGTRNLILAEEFAAVEPGLWRTSVTAGMYTAPEWYRSVEGKLASPQRYVLVEAGPTGAAASLYRTTASTYLLYNPIEFLAGEATLAEIEPHITTDELVRAHELAATVRAGAGADGTVGASPFGATNPLRITADPAAKQRVVDLLETTADEWETPVVAWLYARPEDAALARHFRKRGYVALHAGANCVLDIDFADFEAYLRRLTAGRRSAIRKERRRFAEYGLVVESSDIPPVIDAVAELQARLQRKHGHAYDPEAQRRALEGIVEFLGDYARLSTVVKDGRVGGFCLYYVYEDAAYPKMVGFDDDLLDRRAFAYFNATYYDLIEKATAAGLKRIEYGSHAYDIKLTRGCRADRLVSYVRVPEVVRTEAAELAEIVSSAREREIERHELST
jgi:predicted N-acyltransferase